MQAAPVVSVEGIAGDLDDDPSFLQAYLLSYMEQTAALSAQEAQQARFDGDTPPASVQTIKRLPLIQLREEDLLDPVNRECCVCLDVHHVGHKAVRMPHCSHIFHDACIVDWLKRKCTCPVCRYEHPTDNRDYEEERLTRLQSPNSKPLSRPEPLMEYKLSSLRKMNMSQLRKLMNKGAGVFCLDAKTCTKKEDLIQVFVQSGRLGVLAETNKKRTKKNEDDFQTDPSVKDMHRTEDTKWNKGLRKKIRVFFGPRK